MANLPRTNFLFYTCIFVIFKSLKRFEKVQNISYGQYRQFNLSTIYGATKRHFKIYINHRHYLVNMKITIFVLIIVFFFDKQVVSNNTHGHYII